MTATRDYRRNGILHKTVNGARMKFGKKMFYSFKVSNEFLTDDDFIRYVLTMSEKFLKRLISNSGLEYSYTNMKQTMSDDYDFEHNTCSIILFYQTDQL